MRGRLAPWWCRLSGLRRAGAAVVLAGSVVGGVALAAAPAQAASGVYIHPEWVDGCPGCPGPIFLVQRELDQRTVATVTTAVRAGLSNLIAAKHAQDPAAAKKYQAAAVSALTRASALTGYSAFSPVADGDDVDICPKWPWPWPVPPPPWWDVESQLADGITLLGQAVINKDPGLQDKGIEELGAGAAGLDQYQGCAG